jgi:hypothetical protein
MAIGKENALKAVLEAAIAYENNLANRYLLFVFQKKLHKIDSYETLFRRSNFLHLTGLKVTSEDINASVFYQRCIHKRLSINDFELSSDGTTELKLDVLPSLMCKNLSANMIGKHDSYKVKLYTEKLAGNVRGCMGFVLDSKEKYNVPNTILRQDIRDLVFRPNRIILTYRKRIDENAYSEIVYAAKNYDWSSLVLPAHLSHLPLPDPN